MRSFAIPSALLALSTAAAACVPDKAVSSTTTGHKRPDYAPPPPDTTARATTGNAEVPKSTDAAERVVFAKAGSIWIMNPDGSNAYRLTFAAGAKTPDETPALSPDGKSVAFSSARDGVPKIFLATADGTESHSVTDGADGGDTTPSWTPDSATVVFMRGRPDTRVDLYAVAASGGTPRKILDGRDDDPAHAGWPAVSPDGGWVAFSSDRSDGLGTGIWLVRVDGTGLKRLTRPPQSQAWVRDLRPAWSPDGKRLAFASNRHAVSSDDANDLDVYSVEVSSGEILRLTNDLAAADDPCFSPDGKRIYFTSTRDAPRDYAVELFVMASGGGEQVRLTRDEVPQNAAPSCGRIP